MFLINFDNVSPKRKEEILKMILLEQQKELKIKLITGIDIEKEKSVEGVYIGERQFSTDMIGDFEILEIRKDDGKRIYLMKYTDLNFYDWDSYIDKKVRIDLVGQQFNDKTEMVEYVFSVFVDNESINIPSK